MDPTEFARRLSSIVAEAVKSSLDQVGVLKDGCWLVGGELSEDEYNAVHSAIGNNAAQAVLLMLEESDLMIAETIRDITENS